MTTVRVISAVLDTQRLTLYCEDGEQLTIQQGDPRLSMVLAHIQPQLAADSVAEIDRALLVTTSPLEKFADYEKLSGIVRFFRVMRAELNLLFQNEEISDSDAIAEIMKNAVPASAAAFSAGDSSVRVARDLTDRSEAPAAEKDETIVAIVEGAIISDVELLENQITTAVNTGSTVGVDNLLKRLAAVAKDREFSAQSLLQFAEKGDMPVCEDGSLLVYKVLTTKTSPLQNNLVASDVYVDCHTGKVEQWAGCLVQVPHDQMDWDKNRECSRGLHIARRQYICNFSGSACFLAKLAPEDVAVLPHADANKLRTLAYHLIHQLTPEQHSRVRGNKPWAVSDEEKQLLGNLLVGNHIGVTHTCTINGPVGTDIVYAVVDDKAAPPAPVLNVQAEALPDDVTQKQQHNSPAVLPSDVVKESKLQTLYKAWKASGSQEDLDALVLYKKQCKKSWSALGIEDPTATPEPTNKDVAASVGSPRLQVAALLKGRLTKVNALQILQIKKASKKSWDYLGVHPDTVDAIMRFKS